MFILCLLILVSFIFTFSLDHTTWEIHEPSCPQSCVLKEWSKRGRSVTKLCLPAALEWGCSGLLVQRESVGTLVSTRWKWGRGKDVSPGLILAQNRVMARLNIRPHKWVGVLRIWEQGPLPAELRWCLELGNEGYVMVCNKIIFRFCFGHMLISALSEALEQQEHILSLGDGPLPKSNPESDENTAPLTLLHAPRFGEYGSQVRKWKNCGTEMSVFPGEYVPNSIWEVSIILISTVLDGFSFVRLRNEYRYFPVPFTSFKCLESYIKDQECYVPGQ